MSRQRFYDCRMYIVPASLPSLSNAATATSASASATATADVASVSYPHPAKAAVEPQPQKCAKCGVLYYGRHVRCQKEKSHD